MLGLGWISWSDERAEGGDAVLAHDFDAGDDVALHVGLEIREEWLALLSGIELINLTSLAKFAHFQF